MPHFEGEVQLHRKGQSCPLLLAQAQLMDQPIESYAYHPLILQDSAVPGALQEHPLPFDDRCSILVEMPLCSNRHNKGPFRFGT